MVQHHIYSPKQAYENRELELLFNFNCDMEPKRYPRQLVQKTFFYNSIMMLLIQPKSRNVECLHNVREANNKIGKEKNSTLESSLRAPSARRWHYECPFMRKPPLLVSMTNADYN